ncbi:MAG: RHS repeat protein, partial [Lentisphaeraceae bacterium]|nr:RHS repeat protein [Lentisphaeraceae bacterium]
MKFFKNKSSRLFIGLTSLMLAVTTYATDPLNNCANIPAPVATTTSCLDTCDKSHSGIAQAQGVTADAACQAAGYVKAGSFVDPTLGSYIVSIEENKKTSSINGCKPCGASAKTASTPEVTLTRHYMSRRATEVYDFGLGQSSEFDIRLSFAEDQNGALIALLKESDFSFDLKFVDGRDGDPKDGVFHEQVSHSINEMQLLDGNANLTSDYSLAKTARLLTNQFDVFTFEIIQIGTDYSGRLLSFKNKSGYGYDITYKIFSAAEIAQEPTLLWQRDSVTGANNGVIRFTYSSITLGGEYVISAVTLPNGSQITYEYTDTYLSKVNYPGGASSTYSYRVDAEGQTVYHIEEADAKVKDIYLSSSVSSFTNKYAQVLYNQNSMFATKVEVDNEMTYQFIQHPTVANKRTIYNGAGKIQERHFIFSTRYLKENATITPSADGSVSHSSISGTLESNYYYSPHNAHSNGYGYPDWARNAKGDTRYFSYDNRLRLTKKLYEDGASESYQYNDLNQITQYRDRLGNITRKTYDALGNLLSKEKGLQELTATQAGTTGQQAAGL